ncbi:MAG: universal stress protein [Bacteroidota bacterium]
MNKLLFPTDFSEAAHHALAYTVAFAEAIPVKIKLMHVVSLSVDEAAKIHPQKIEAAIEKRKEAAKERLLAIQATYPNASFEAPRVDYGLFYAQEIADAAQSEGADLIAMGTKGITPMQQRLLGSTVTNTMMIAPCPVLAIPRTADFTLIEKIAYGTDFRLEDEHAVNTLVKFSTPLNANIHFVHIDQNADSTSIEDYHLDNKEPFSDFTVVNAQDISEGLTRFITQKNIQVLALFVPRRRLWERLFHSSVSKEMMKYAKIPLLVFHQ